MRLPATLAGCAALVAACTPAPAPAVRVRPSDPSGPPPEEAAPGVDTGPSPASAGAASSVPEAPPATAVEATTTTTVTIHLPHAATPTTLALPENKVPASDSAWLASQPGYSLPPDCIRNRESGGDYRAVSPDGTYGGAYQFSLSTWRSVGGSGRPQDADPDEQDFRASLLWDHGRGASHWGGGC